MSDDAHPHSASASPPGADLQESGKPRPGLSFRLGRFFGIDVIVHWSFWLLLVWVLFTTGFDLAAFWRMALFVLAIFACVVMHEYGHALTARRFGIRTRDITLLPIGGVARLEGMPDRPDQEVLVAIAGPLVNVVIAGLLLAFLLPTGAFQFPDLSNLTSMNLAGFLSWLAIVNVMLVLFNMIPAFPMDGGRVLRALLATRMGRAKATNIAARVGQVVAVGFALLAIFAGFSPFLLLIALFVFFGGAAEAQAEAQREAFTGLRVHDAMMTEYETLEGSATLAAASQRLLAGSQHDFPVTTNGSMLGILNRDALIEAISEHGEQATVDQAVRPIAQPVDPEDSLYRVLQVMQATRQTALPVVAMGRVIGLLTLENAQEVAGIRRARMRSRRK